VRNELCLTFALRLSDVPMTFVMSYLTPFVKCDTNKKMTACHIVNIEKYC
jgi:hypothetical protein